MDDVAMTTAARRLGLEPGALRLAVELGEVRSVRAPDRARTAGTADGGGPAGRTGGGPQRRVPRSEVARLRSAVDFPDGLLERLHTVHADGGARLLGISRSRFARLARAGFFSAVRCRVNRYRTVVWQYRAEELRQFAEQHPQLLSGPLPRGLREVLAEGVDLRARHYRGRLVARLCREAESLWESAAARAAVLPREILAEAVPDPAERARLDALRPELTPYRGRTEEVREQLRRLVTAAGEDEILRHRLLLAADLESARAVEPLDGERHAGRQPGSARAALPAPAAMTDMRAVRTVAACPSGVRTAADSRAAGGGSGVGVPAGGRTAHGDRRTAGAVARAGRTRQRAAAKRARALLRARRASRHGPVRRLGTRSVSRPASRTGPPEPDLLNRPC